MMKVFSIFLLFSFASISKAFDIIPYDKKDWTKFEKIQSMGLNVPVLVNKKSGGIGIIKEEILPLTAEGDPVKRCKQLHGVQESRFCRLENKQTVTYLFHKKYKKGIFYQSVSLEKKFTKAIKNFEAGMLK